MVLRPASLESVRAFVDRLHHFGLGVSWGGYESLVLQMEPPRTAVANTRQGALIRFGIGLDDVETLKADLAAALPLLALQDCHMTNKIDHFAIGTASLDDGVAALLPILGVEVPRGGRHAAMSTHNCVMQAGNESFFELLAIDPDAPEPGRARWFTMDDPATKTRLATRPRALCWVVGTDDLDAVIASSPVDPGEVVLFTRGDRSWRLTVPKDGSLLMGGLRLAFIEWSPGPHPSTGQQNLGVTLQNVCLSHPDPGMLTDILQRLGIAGLAKVEPGDPTLRFELMTPKGQVTLD